MGRSQPVGNSVIYSTFIGGNGNDHANAIALDASGNAYITGDTDSSNFPHTGGFQTIFGGGFWDAFVVKLSASGTLVYGSYLGGTLDDKGYGIAVDAAGSAYVTGYTASPHFPTTTGAYQTATAGNAVGPTDVFVSKVSPSGNQLTYSTYLGGTDYDYGRGIAVDASGAAYVTGYTARRVSPSWPVTIPVRRAAA